MGNQFPIGAFRAATMGKLAVVTVALVALFATVGYQAPLPPEVKDALHDVKILNLNKQDKSSQIYNLRGNPSKFDIVRIDINIAELSTAQIEILKNWAEQGHGLWIRTQRRGWLREFNIESNKDNSRDNPLATATDSGHPILTDVERIKISEGNSRALKTNYDVPLLTKNSNVLAALKYLGNGSILFSHFVVRDKFDSERYVANWKEFLAGFPVPPSVVEGGIPSEPAAKHDRVILDNQDALSGTVTNESFTIEASYGIFTFDKPEISGIDFGQNVHTMSLRNGDRLTGTIQETEITINLVSGEEQTIPVSQIRRIVFAKPSDS